jgi:hypothetical protein
MRKRPWSITAVAFILALAGILDIVSHVPHLKPAQPFPYDALWPLALGAVAVVCGLFLLRRSNWARWVSVVWLAFHVVVGGLNSRQQLIVHGLLLVVFAYLLFRSEANGYFRAVRADGSLQN